MGQLCLLENQRSQAIEALKRAIEAFESEGSEDGRAMAQQMFDQVSGKLQKTAKKQEADEERESAVQVKQDAQASVAAAPVYKGPSLEEIVQEVQSTALELIGDEELGMDTPLMDAGLDSLAAVEFQSMLAKVFTGVQQPTTLVFDFPS